MSCSCPLFPLRVEIELSSACNLQCVYCPRHYLPPLGQFIDIALFANLVEQIQPYKNTILTLHRRGESLLHPQFSDIMNLVSAKFAEIQMATNASVLYEHLFEPLVRGLSFLSFSIDLPERFDKTRCGAEYVAVEYNIRKFLEYNKKRVRTQVSMVRTSDVVQKDVDRFISLWHDKVDRVRVYEEHSKNGVFGALNDTTRVERKPCTMPFYEILVYADGTVGRCNHDWDGPRLGDLNTQTIEDVWNGEALLHLREQHTSLCITDIVCKNCDSWYPEFGVQATGKVVER